MSIPRFYFSILIALTLKQQSVSFFPALQEKAVILAIHIFSDSCQHQIRACDSPFECLHSLISEASTFSY